MLREALTATRLQAMAPGDASAYFVSRSAEGLSASERGMLADWLAADHAHVLAYERAKRGWESLDDADGNEILTAMRAHAVSARPQGWLSKRYAFAAVATLFLLVATSVLFSPLSHVLTGQGGGTSGTQIAWTQYASGHGEVRNIRLSDGSTITLDTDSVVQTHFAPGERSIRLLQGRGLFEVAKDAARPFAVAAEGRRVVALGTRFEVDTNDNALRVSLFRGRVAVQPLVSSGKTVLLNAGQRFVEKDGAIAVGAIGPGTAAQPAWLGGMIDLDDMPLGEAARQVNRYSHAQIVISDPAVASIRVSGQFRATDAARFAETVTEVYPVRMIRRDSRIELAPAD